MIKDLFSSSQNKWLYAGMAVLIVLFFVLHKKSEKLPVQSKDDSSETEPQSVDTMIPTGHALVPLHLENIENLAALIGTFAAIDLYKQTEGGLLLIAENIKLLQAPLNPEIYAVLVKYPLSRQIMQHGGPYWATVLNHKNHTSAQKKYPTEPDPDIQVQSSTKNKSSNQRKKNTVKAASRHVVHIEYHQSDDR